MPFADQTIIGQQNYNNIKPNGQHGSNPYSRQKSLRTADNMQ